MNSKAKALPLIRAGIVALTLLVAVSAPHSRRVPAVAPHVRPVLAVTSEHRALTLPAPVPTPVGKKTADVEPDSTPPAEIDFEPPKPNEPTEILTTKEPPRDKPTPEPVPPKTTVTVAATEPQMGHTRTVDGQKQVYILGFGWIENNDTPNECTYVEDMYENGNKVGNMGGGTCVDGEGDINKMVGIM